MIEKLEKPKSIRWDDDVDSCIQRHKIIVDAISKINEIIDVLNAIVIDTKDGTFIDGSKKAEPVDKFAEQRKWIGCLCRFWFDNKKQADVGILGDIEENDIHPYFNADLGHNYKCCEPVKPNDDIIYKGE